MKSGCTRLTVVLVLAAILATCKPKLPGQAGPSDEELQAMRQECARIMPKTFSKVWVGMTEEEFKTVRPDAAFQAHRTDPMERRWFHEDSPTGVSVWYGVDRPTERLAVVQFAHRFVSWSIFRSHAAALQDRFGTGYELYTCPGGATKVAMTRLLWPRQPVAVMEAVLEMTDSISVTMIVSRVEACRQSIEKQKCVRVDREKALDHWIEEQMKDEGERLKKEKQEGHGHGRTPPPGAGLPTEQPEKTDEK